MFSTNVNVLIEMLLLLTTNVLVTMVTKKKEQNVSDAQLMKLTLMASALMMILKVFFSGIMPETTITYSSSPKTTHFVCAQNLNKCVNFRRVNLWRANYRQ